MFTDEAVSRLITVITSTHPIPTIPATTHLYSAQASLFHLPALRSCKKIIVFDGIKPGQEKMEERYLAYQREVAQLVKSDRFFANTELLICPEWRHLSGALALALEQVDTPFVFIHQHDLILTKSFDLNQLVASMSINSDIQYVHFWGYRNQHNPWYEDHVDGSLTGTHFVPLCPFYGWSDQTHIATKDYYTSFVLPQCERCFMEEVLWRDHNRMRKTQTYLYGTLSDGNYIMTTDGSEKENGSQRLPF